MNGETMFFCVVEYYAALKRRDILTPAITRMGLGDAVLSDISQTEKDRSPLTPLLGGP